MPRRRIWTSRAIATAVMTAAVVGFGAQASAQAAPPSNTPPAPTEANSAPSATPAGAEPAKGAAAPLERLAIVRTELSNGLRIVMSPDRSIPTVAVAIYYDVGSRNEQPGRSGFAHLFEHMMFQGSANVGKGEHFSLIMNRGGSVNGTTSHDRTNYFQTLPSNELALGLWLEADRMRSLAITQENFENQRQTVMEERRQSYDNQPYMASMLRINELAYGDYWPYAHSTIGDMADLQRSPLEDAQAFFEQYYPPNNAVLSIAGDFDPEEALALAEQYFGDIPRRDVPAYDPPEFTPPGEERRDTMYDPLAELPAFHIAYHIPPNRTPDHYPLELMGIILGDGASSRLFQSLVKQREILRDIDVGTDDRRGPDLFSFWAVVSKEHSGEDARRIIYSTLDDIAKKGVTARELEKAKNRVRSAFVFGLESNLSRAMRLAEYEIYYGNAELLQQELQRFLDVTTADVQRVAQIYFAPENRTVLDVLPGQRPQPAVATDTSKAPSKTAANEQTR